MKGNKYNTITKARKVTATHRIRAHVSLQTFQVCKALHHRRKYVGWQVRVQCLFVREIASPVFDQFALSSLTCENITHLSKLTRRSLNSLWKIFSLNFEKWRKAIIYVREDQMALEPCRSVSTSQFYFQSFWTVPSLWSKPNSSQQCLLSSSPRQPRGWLSLLTGKWSMDSIGMRGLFILCIIFAFLSDNN